MRIRLPAVVVGETSGTLGKIGSGLNAGVANPEVFVVSCLLYVVCVAVKMF
jgi:hypothetical protein